MDIVDGWAWAKQRLVELEEKTKGMLGCSKRMGGFMYTTGRVRNDYRFEKIRSGQDARERLCIWKWMMTEEES